MTDIPLNTYIEWTDADRERGECPVPARSSVTLWLSNGDVCRVNDPEEWSWEKTDVSLYILDYLVHSIPRETIVRWIVVGGSAECRNAFDCRLHAKHWAKEYGGRVVKLVEVDDD